MKHWLLVGVIIIVVVVFVMRSRVSRTQGVPAGSPTGSGVAAATMPSSTSTTAPSSPRDVLPRPAFDSPHATPVPTH